MISKPLAALIEEGRRTPGVDYVAALEARQASRPASRTS